MASYYTVYVTMNRLLKFIRKKTGKTTSNEVCLDTSPADLFDNGCGSSSSLPADVYISPRLKDLVDQLNGHPISKQNAVYTDEENKGDLIGLEDRGKGIDAVECEQWEEEEEDVNSGEYKNDENSVADVCESCEPNAISDNVSIETNLNKERVTLDNEYENHSCGSENCMSSGKVADEAEKNDRDDASNRENRSGSEKGNGGDDESNEQYDIGDNTENEIDSEKGDYENERDKEENTSEQEEDNSVIDEVFNDDDSACEDVVVTTPSEGTTPDALAEDVRCTEERKHAQCDDNQSIEEELRTVRRDLCSPTSSISFSSYSSQNSSTISSQRSHTSTKSLKKLERNGKSVEKSRSKSNKRMIDISSLPRSSLGSQRKFFETDSDSECSMLGNTDRTNLATTEYVKNELPSDILDCFKLFDESNGNPYVTLSDVKSASSLFGILIHNNDCRKITHSFSDRELKLIFDHLDGQQVGYITAQEIVKEMKKLGDFLTKAGGETVSEKECPYKRINFSQFVRFCKHIDRSTNIVGVDEDDTKWMELNYIALNDCG